jgi:hypothetical protein
MGHSKRKTAAKTAVVHVSSGTAPVRVRQPHGGALFSGGVPGNRGGTGKPRSEVRQALREGAAKAVPRLQEIVTRPDTSAKDVIAASRVMLEFGVGRPPEIEEVTPSEEPTGEENTRRMAELLPRVLNSLWFSVPELMAMRDVIDDNLRVRAILEGPKGSVAPASSSGLEGDPRSAS